MNVIIREGNLGEDDLVAFDLDTRCNFGMIWCVDRNGSGEACMDYYHNTKKADDSRVREMVNFLEKCYDEKVTVKHRLSYATQKRIWSEL
jgi:hypothetical protein